MVHYFFTMFGWLLYLAQSCRQTELWVDFMSFACTYKILAFIFQLIDCSWDGDFSTVRCINYNDGNKKKLWWACVCPIPRGGVLRELAPERLQVWHLHLKTVAWMICYINSTCCWLAGLFVWLFYGGEGEGGGGLLFKVTLNSLSALEDIWIAVASPSCLSIIKL